MRSVDKERASRADFQLLDLLWIQARRSEMKIVMFVQLSTIAHFPMLKSQPARKAGPSIAASKAKGFKSIPDTADLLRRNEGQKRKGKGKERAVLDGLHDLMKGMW